MQHAHDTALATDRDPKERSSGPLSPGRAFLILLALLIAAFGIFRLTNPADAPAPPAQAPPSATPEDELTQPSQTLTRAEALSTFRNLRNSALAAIRTRSKETVDDVFARTGPTHKRALVSINQLKRDGVLDKSQVHTLSTDVLAQSHDKIRAMETSLLLPCFVTERGKVVTKSAKVIRQTSIWTLKKRSGDWLVNDVVLKKDVSLNRSYRRCG